MMAGLTLLAGCSSDQFKARVLLYQAGQLYYKTDNQFRRIQHMPFQERKRFYAQACQLYYRAFQLNSEVFHMDEIEHALQCCESGEESERTEAFQNFYEVYQAEHPIESAYGLVSGASEG